MGGAFVSIGGNLLDDAIVARVQIVQRLNDHWTCEIECRDTLGHPIPAEDAIGAECTIANTAEDGTEHIAFRGIIMDVALKREVWGSYGCILQAASRSWLIDHSPRNAYFGTSSLAAVADLISGPAAVVSSLPEQSSPAEYVQFGETNWRFLLRLADDHGGWIRAGANGTELRNQFDSPQPLIFRDHYGLLEFSIAGDVRPARIAASQYDSAVNRSQLWSGETKAPTLEVPGQRMASAVQGASSAAQLTGFAARSRSWTAEQMRTRAQFEAERMGGTAVVATGTSRALGLLAGGSISLENLGEANGTWNLLEVTHVWDRTGYLNHFRATPWSTWRAPERPQPPSAPGVQPARVVSNVDPDGRGRLVVSLFWQEGALLLAPMTSLHCGAGFGLTMMPEVGDEVLVGFLDADPERPVILGSLWNGVQQPPATGFHVPGETNGSEFAGNNIKRLVTKSGNRIHITDTPGKESISLATPRSNNFLLSEQVAETDRPAITMHTTGDIHLRAAGRIHRQSATHSSQVGTSGPSLAGMSCAEKMEAAIKGAPLAKGVLDALGGAKGVAIMLGAAAVIQAIPVAGEIEDLIALIGVIGLGLSVKQIYEGLKELYQFKQACCQQAKTPDDLKKAGVLFADAVGKIGVNALGAVLGVKALKGARGAGAVEEEAATLRGKTPVPSELAATEIAGLKPVRVLPGSNGKVAVIGRSMGSAVDPYAAGLKAQGYEVETFTGDQIPKAAGDQWEELKTDYAPAYIPDDVVQQSQLYQANQAWAQKLSSQGYTVIDVGNPSNAGSSPFYNMEQDTIFKARN